MMYYANADMIRNQYSVELAVKLARVSGTHLEQLWNQSRGLLIRVSMIPRI